MPDPKGSDYEISAHTDEGPDSSNTFKIHSCLTHNMFRGKIWLHVKLGSSNQTLELLQSCHHLLRCPLKASRAKYIVDNFQKGISKEESLVFEKGFFEIPDLRQRRG